MVLNLQEEVKNILHRPEQLSEGKRDPFHKNYAHEEDASSRDSDRDRSLQDHNGMSQDEESVDLDQLKKLTFKELLDRERQKDSDSSKHEFISRFVPGEHSSNGNGSSSRLQMLVSNKAPTTTFYPAMQQLQMQMGSDPSMHLGFTQPQVQQPVQYLQTHLQPQGPSAINGQGYHYMQQQMQPPMQYHQLPQNFAHAQQFAGQMHGFQSYPQMQSYPNMLQGYQAGYYGTVTQSQHVQGHLMHSAYPQPSQPPMPEGDPSRGYPAYATHAADDPVPEHPASTSSPSENQSPEKQAAPFFDKRQPQQQSQQSSKSTFRMPPSPFASAPSGSTYQNK